MVGFNSDFAWTELGLRFDLVGFGRLSGSGFNAKAQRRKGTVKVADHKVV